MEIVEELRTWAQPSNLVAMLELRAELSKVQMKREDDPEVLSSVLLKSSMKMLEFQWMKQKWLQH